MNAGLPVLNGQYILTITLNLTLNLTLTLTLTLQVVDVMNAGLPAINGQYTRKSASLIPAGFR